MDCGLDEGVLKRLYEVEKSMRTKEYHSITETFGLMLLLFWRKRKITIPSGGGLCYTNIGILCAKERSRFRREGESMRQFQCKYCGRTFQSTYSRTFCKECEDVEEILFSRIEEYLKKFPNSNALQISEGLDVPIFMVLRYIDEGRLLFSRGTFEKLK